jgi:hypothetical protein
MDVNVEVSVEKNGGHPKRNGEADEEAKAWVL